MEGRGVLHRHQGVFYLDGQVQEVVGQRLELGELLDPGDFFVDVLDADLRVLVGLLSLEVALIKVLHVVQGKHDGLKLSVLVEAPGQ